MNNQLGWSPLPVGAIGYDWCTQTIQELLVLKNNIHCKMNYNNDRKIFLNSFFIVIFLSLLLGGCNLNVLPNEQLIESIEPSTPIPNPNPILSPSLTFCTGWHCEITGIVSIETAVPTNQLVSETVKLSQISWCSPTSGEQDAQLDTDANSHLKFIFTIQIHSIFMWILRGTNQKKFNLVGLTVYSAIVHPSRLTCKWRNKIF